MFPFTLQQLRILKAVATEKNFTKAAELVYISQPSLSKQIKILEKNLQISLIIRKKNKIYLTETGKIFLQYSERILALCEESCRALIDLKNIERGELTIGASQAIGTYLLSRILALFIQNYPQIHLKVHINSTKFITKSILDREIDLAIIGHEIPTKLKKNLIIKSFVEDEFTLIISKFHPFAIKKKITKKDLYDLNFITLNSNSIIRKFIDNILTQNHIEIKQLKIIMQLNSSEGIKTAVNLGLGAAFISSALIKKELGLRKIASLRIENIQINRGLTIIHHPESYKSKAFKIFYGELSKLKHNL
uniref:Probable RuBisCO transcriptional regulator n=1 Tax=Climaconeis cf. scalaris TaxID=2846828 RepID=A0A8F8SR79_9STRA|nr:rubisco operon transcription regulator [Climaconeis cf. scalaris]QYB19128.1 rubisco operon transcription regulator [Climaconeis cf. scalaris]